MNDEELVSENANDAEISTGDTVPTVASLSSEIEATERATQQEGNGEVDPAISADPLPDPDSDASEPAGTSEESGLEQLRGELNRLKAKLAAREEMLTRIGFECEEFRTLYPDKALTDLSDSVWEEVRRGVPIAAAFALSERRRQLTEQKASESNLSNGRRSAGAVGGVENDYFSPAEVRAMSQTQVRENYQQIMRSMQKWH